MRLLLVLAFYCTFLSNIVSQVSFSKDYFRYPVGINFRISSNFGEIRPNHFHAGLDVYTFVKSGINYYAVADGYISRIKVSPRGLGNAIYITHPNGYVSVYAHMSKFRLDIAQYIYKLQHSAQEFYQDIYLSPKLFPLKSGDYIGKSGNTGNSFGAHLHFELREEESEIPVNPLHAYNIVDKVSPRIKGLYMYRFEDENKSYVTSRLLGKASGSVIKTYGKVAFGLEIHDYISNSHNVFGVYKLEMFVDDSLYYGFKMDKISFDETRYLNSFVDYKRYKTEKKKITKCFIEPNNKLGIYTTKGNGIVDFSDGKLHKVKIVGTDINGNSKAIKFKILSDSTRILQKKVEKNHVVKNLNCFKENSFDTDSFKVFFPLNSLYYNLDLQYYSSVEPSFSKYSKLHYLHDLNIPIHHAITIKIKPDSMPANLKDKALIASISRKGKIYAVNSHWDGDFLVSKVKNFGSYFVRVDTISPRIRPLSFNRSKMIKSELIKFKITDNLSGVKEYTAYIDKKWVLFEYDQKNNLITCNLKKEKISKGEHKLSLRVTDYCGNVKMYKTKFKF